MTHRSFNRKERQHTQADCGQGCATGTRGTTIAPTLYGVYLIDRGLSGNSHVLPTLPPRPEGVLVGSRGATSGPSPYALGVVEASPGTTQSRRRITISVGRIASRGRCKASRSS